MEKKSKFWDFKWVIFSSLIRMHACINSLINQLIACKINCTVTVKILFWLCTNCIKSHIVCHVHMLLISCIQWFCLRKSDSDLKDRAGRGNAAGQTGGGSETRPSLSLYPVFYVFCHYVWPAVYNDTSWRPPVSGCVACGGGWETAGRHTRFNAISVTFNDSCCWKFLPGAFGRDVASHSDAWLIRNQI